MHIIESVSAVKWELSSEGPKKKCNNKVDQRDYTSTVMLHFAQKTLAAWCHQAVVTVQLAPFI